MSYAFFGFGACPEGWTEDPATKVCTAPPSITECPPEFKRVGNDCWPATESACFHVLGTFFNPAEPDRCKGSCPVGTVPDANHVCRPVAQAAAVTVAKQASAIAPVEQKFDLSTLISVGAVAVGATALLVFIARGSS